MTANLDALAEKLRLAEYQCTHGLEMREQGRELWVTGMVSRSVCMAEARAAFPSNADFGQWFDGTGLEMNKNDRAAFIRMGQQPDIARQAFEKTTRNSAQLILLHDFRLPSARKTTDPKPRPVNRANEEKRARAFAAYDRRKTAGEDMNMAAVAAEAGVSNTVVRRVFTTRQAEEVVRAEITTEAERLEFIRPLEEEVLRHIASLKGADKKRWDKQVEQYHYHIKQMVSDRTGAWVRKWKEETGAAYYEARLDKQEELFTAWPYSVMRKTEYNTIMRCLHPDTAHSRSDEERAEAFRLFTHYKLKMVHDDEEARAARGLRSDMPKTVQEMLARKAARDAEMKAKREAKKASA